MSDGIIFDLRRYAVHDGPGIRTTLFLKGCPLNCQWCHNPESQSFGEELMVQKGLCINCEFCRTACSREASAAGSLLTRISAEGCHHCATCADSCPTGARMRCGKFVSVAEILPQLLRDRPFYDQSGGGVTFSGGEPLAQPEFLMDLLEHLGREEIHRCLDTSGYATAELLRLVATKTELFLYDLKLMDNAAHQHYTGVDNKLILDNLRLLAELKARVIVRVPLLPGINDDAENLTALGSFVRSLAQDWSVQLLPYHRLPESKYAALDRCYLLPELRVPEPQEMERAASLLHTFINQVFW